MINPTISQQYAEQKRTPQVTQQPSGNEGILFTIVFPSRDRTGLLFNLLQSIKRNTTGLAYIEVLIAVDEDDKITQNFLVNNKYGFVKMFVVPRSKDMNFSRDYYNFLAKQSKGRWIITANDDCVFETEGWDVIAYNVLKDQPGVVYGWIQDGIDGFRAQGHGNYCCFPLQGRAGFEALGYIFPPRIPNWGADIWAKGLYDQVDSVVEVPITLRHFCHHNQTRDQDAISKRIAMNQVPFDMKPSYQEVNALLGALRKEVVAK